MPALRMKGTVAAFLLTAVSAAGDDQARIDAPDATPYDTQAATSTGSPEESGVRTLIFRSLESPDVQSIRRIVRSHPTRRSRSSTCIWARISTPSRSAPATVRW